MIINLPVASNSNLLKQNDKRIIRRIINVNTDTTSNKAVHTNHKGNCFIRIDDNYYNLYPMNPFNS